MDKIRLFTTIPQTTLRRMLLRATLCTGSGAFLLLCTGMYMPQIAVKKFVGATAPHKLQRRLLSAINFPHRHKYYSPCVTFHISSSRMRWGWNES